jgi:hypothetical protein
MLMSRPNAAVICFGVCACFLTLIGGAPQPAVDPAGQPAGEAARPNVAILVPVNGENAKETAAELAAALAVQWRRQGMEGRSANALRDLTELLLRSYLTADMAPYQEHMRRAGAELNSAAASVAKREARSPRYRDTLPADIASADVAEQLRYFWARPEARSAAISSIAVRGAVAGRGRPEIFPPQGGRAVGQGTLYSPPDERPLQLAFKKGEAEVAWIRVPIALKGSTAPAEMCIIFVYSPTMRWWYPVDLTVLCGGSDHPVLLI